MNFRNAYIYTKNYCFEQGNFSIEQGKFARVLENAAGDAYDLEGKYVIPGLIDIHTHGNSGFDFSDGSYEGLKTMCRYYAKHGITSFAPTSLTVPYDQISAAYKTAKLVHEENEKGLAKIRGINMEGPFFSVKKKGAQNVENIRLPDCDAFMKLNEDSGNLIKIIDIAPELEGALEFIEKVSPSATVSVAHTDCTYEEAAAAFQAGATQLTHMFNAMPSIHHRQPGPIIAAMENGNVMTELICDGHHIHPAIIRFAFQTFGAQRMIIVSDSLRCCGMPDGKFDIGGQEAYISNGVAKLADGTLAGSMTNVYECLKNVISFGIRKEDAVRAATYNPARQLGCLDEVGSIENGKAADFLVLDEDFNLESVFIDGEMI